jgi:hypothetical protein
LGQYDSGVFCSLLKFRFHDHHNGTGNVLALQLMRQQAVQKGTDIRRGYFRGKRLRSRSRFRGHDLGAGPTTREQSPEAECKVSGL